MDSYIVDYEDCDLLKRDTFSLVDRYPRIEESCCFHHQDMFMLFYLGHEGSRFL
jgi:hypothetical protein